MRNGMMEMDESRFDRRAAQAALLAWYGRCARDLPWRRTRDPYRIWVSEVMLQQTRVETVLRYYDAFLERFPDLESLACADEESLLKAWEGLGYYRRARNLQKAARRIIAGLDADQKAGRAEVPSDPEAFRALPGVGPYTAAAVQSIAFGRPMGAVDGNVQRVLARWFAWSDPVDAPAGRRRIQKLADELTVRSDPGRWKQAVMELGATICLPRSPRCSKCPVEPHCLARREGKAAELPTRVQRRRIRPVHRHVAVVRGPAPSRYWLVRRPEGGVLEGMWEFPALEAGGPGPVAVAVLAAHLEAGWGLAVESVRTVGRAEHTFTHLRWLMQVYLVEAKAESGRNGRWFDREALAELALPRAVQKVAEAAGALGPERS